jgi:excisionase family DNA binding protein
MGDVQSIDGYEPLATTTELCERLKVSKSTVRKMCREGMPYIPLTNVTQRCIRFRMSEVYRWLTEREKRTA